MAEPVIVSCPVVARTGVRRLVRHAMLAIGLAAGLAGCATPERGPSVSRDMVGRTTFVGIQNARFTIGDTDDLLAEYIDSARREIAWRASRGMKGPLPPASYLAISGGGDDGAYGAGVLLGWTARGDRPEFKVVTGVSTGALSSPFAFLGPDYDDELKTVYTALGPQDIFEERPIWAAVTDDALADTAPLYGTISRFLDETMMRRLAEEYKKGRLLFIMSTNLDVAAPVIWNIGAIAASGHPGARDLILKLMLASSAMPAAFPPVMIDAQVDGQNFQEMHVDGGVIAQVFLYPAQLDVSQMKKIDRKRTAYIIRNARLIGDTSKVDRLTTSIAGRAISTMIAVSGLNDMNRIYATTQRDGVAFRDTYIEPDFNTPYVGPFDSGYMTTLFNYGFARGKSGAGWYSTPPGWE